MEKTFKERLSAVRRGPARLALGLSFGLALSLAAPAAVQAATMYFSPTSGSYAVGDTVVVEVMVDSPDQAMNAASGTITFPEDKLEFQSVTKDGTILDYWTVEPDFAAGRGSFEGLVFNPGYQGSGGDILQLRFRAKSPGAASLVFASFSVLANDGQGTNILKSVGRSTYIISGAAAQPPAPEPGPGAEPAGKPAVKPQPSQAVVTSPTHPDQNKWYANSDPQFAWALPAGTIGVNFVNDDRPVTDPELRSIGLTRSHSLRDVGDGIWYFHLRLRDDQYGWYSTTHFRYQIDTEGPPPFSVTLLDGKETDQSRPKISFKTADALSGVARYEVTVDGGSPVAVPRFAEAAPYELPVLEAGAHSVRVEAFDQAGNSTSASEQFTIKPAAVRVPLGLLFGGLNQAGGEAEPPESMLWAQLTALLLVLAVLLLMIIFLRRRSCSSAKELEDDIRRLMSEARRSYDDLDTRVHAELNALDGGGRGPAYARREEQTCRRLRRRLRAIQNSLLKALKHLKDKND